MFYIVGVKLTLKYLILCAEQIVDMAKKFVEQGKADTESDLELLSQPSSQVTFIIFCENTIIVIISMHGCGTYSFVRRPVSPLKPTRMTWSLLLKTKSLSPW